MACRHRTIPKDFGPERKNTTMAMSAVPKPVHDD